MPKILLLAFLLIISTWFVQTRDLKTSKNTLPAENIAVSEEKRLENNTFAKTEEETSSVTPQTKPDSEKPKIEPAAETPKETFQTPPTTAQKPTDNGVTSTPPSVPDFEIINTFTRQSIVNILCEAKNSQISAITGSGVVISPDGVILTNAHIAQYFLLRDYLQKDFVTCVIRTDSPAYPQYRAELVYISPTWVESNASVVVQSEPKGTGENDFALLRITEKMNGQPPELPIPYLLPNTNEITLQNGPVLLASYPAGFLGGLSILQGLYITSSITAIQEIFTFDKNTVDLISVGGTVVSQKGSSGGAVVDKNSSLIGLIVTSSTEETTGERDLRAITIPYINRALQKEIGISLTQFLLSDVGTFAKSFQETIAPTLSKLITDELDGQ